MHINLIYLHIIIRLCVYIETNKMRLITNVSVCSLKDFNIVEAGFDFFFFFFFFVTLRSVLDDSAV